MQLNQEKNKVNIDISIAESRIKDLQGLKDLTLSQIEDILSEKRKMDKENADIDQKVQGKGLTETDLKLKQIDAEREMIKKIQNSLKNHKENANYAMDRLKDEETKAKDMLDEKIKQQQILNQVNEDLADGRALAAKNREEIIKLQIKLSTLITQDEKLQKELNSLTEENTFYIKKNSDFEKDNTKLQKEIHATLQKIEINYLLKEVDIEDLRLVTQNNKVMTSTLHQLMNKWENIAKIEAEGEDGK